MYLLKVLVQHKIYKLDRIFFYASENEVLVGTRVSINFNNQEIIGFVDEVQQYDGSIEECSNNLGFEIKFIDKVIDDEPIINNELLTLARKLSDYYLYPLIGVLQTMLPPSLKPKDTLYHAPKIKYESFYKLNSEKILSRKFNTFEERILKKFDAKPILTTSSISKTKTLEHLIQEEVISIITKEVNRYESKITFEYEDKISLTNEQQNAYEAIVNGDEHAYLLKGVTGSGKTEVYIKLIENILNEGKTAILLVPEIALTPLMISRILSYFKEGVAVLHSSLSDAQKYDEYRKISRGDTKITIGTRSAIFAPNKNLGLIIIDEENDECYKQDDQHLLYNAKEVALMRALGVGAKVVFGSATPSIDLMAKTNNGSIKLVELKHRYNNVALPDVSIVNRLDVEIYSIASSIFSLPMISEIKSTLARGEQIILLINSRGYSNYVMCRECGHIFKCPTCGLPLHYHKNKDILYCHHCEYKIKMPKKCPTCEGTFFSFNNYGIQKVEEDFKKIFNVPYVILDSDRAPKTFQIETVLKEFNDKKVQVLIGTQLVSKGHDFKDVSFVGVLNADTMLNYPNYRSKEITFNLLTQTIGRAGRSNGKGKAIIQTSKVNDYAILCAANQDYDAFYKAELAERKALNNPPFASICAITISSKKYDLLVKQADSIKKFLLSLQVKNLKVLGPSLIRNKNKELTCQIFIKYKRLVDIKDSLKSLIDVYGTQSNIKVRINFNPYSF